MLLSVDLVTFIALWFSLAQSLIIPAALMWTSSLQVSVGAGLYFTGPSWSGSLPFWSALAPAFSSLICAGKDLHPPGPCKCRPLSILPVLVWTWFTWSTTLSSLNPHCPSHCDLWILLIHVFVAHESPCPITIWHLFHIGLPFGCYLILIVLLAVNPGSLACSLFALWASCLILAWTSTLGSSHNVS